MSKNKTRSKTKDIIFGIIIFMLCGAMCAVAMGAMGVFDKDRNPDNLLTLEDYDPINKRITETGHGIKFDWNDDGSFTVNGSNGVPDVKENGVSHYAFASVTLEPGTYTISGYDKSQLNTLGIYAEVDGNKVYENTADATFTISETQDVVVGVYVCNDKLFVNTKVCPTLVPGDAVGEFYKD